MACRWRARPGDTWIRPGDTWIGKMAEKSGRKLKLTGQGDCSTLSWHDRRDYEEAQLILGSCGCREQGARDAMLRECGPRDWARDCKLVMKQVSGPAANFDGNAQPAAGIQYGNPNTKLYMPPEYGEPPQYRWHTVSRNDARVERHLLASDNGASDNGAEVLGSYVIEKNGFIFKQITIVMREHLDSLLAQIALAAAARHVTRDGQYYKVPRHSTEFEFRNPRNMK